MKLARGLIPLIFIFLFCSHASANIRPSFWLEACSWRATHIVVATEGKKIDGVLRVLESWKGELMVGETIRIPELAAFNPTEARKVHPLWSDTEPGAQQVYVTGERIVLFLRDAKQMAAEVGEEAREDQAVKSPSVPSRWKTANSMGDEIKVSMVWIEQGDVYGFVQQINPGPTLLSLLPWSEAKMQQQVMHILETRDALNSSLTIADPARRAEALQPFVGDQLFFANQAAFEGLAKCGEAALPVLRKIMNDDSLVETQENAIEAFAQAGGNTVADELTALVEKELKFWQQTAPTLQKGWWNGAGFASIDEVEPLRDRYGKVYRALIALKPMRYRPCEKIVTEFRDYWRSLSQLDDKSGLDQISEACDSILKDSVQDKK
ncbi:MAG: hypothetical protein H0W99_01675 [Acidobacteria bacterium]|nr:hypothetical protein [Acidobacteriota bacterium]